MAREQKVIVQEVDRAHLDAMAPGHQGLIAVVSAYAYKTVDDMLALAKERGEAPFLVILDGVTDPHNLGAIIRSAECAGRARRDYSGAPRGGPDPRGGESERGRGGVSAGSRAK